MSEHYDRLGLVLHGTLASIVPEPAEALGDILALLQAMIRNACVNYGDGKCEEARNIAVIKTYLDKHKIKYQVHSKPGMSNISSPLTKATLDFYRTRF
jgi:hypothetical protein